MKKTSLLALLSFSFFGAHAMDVKDPNFKQSLKHCFTLYKLNHKDYYKVIINALVYQQTRQMSPSEHEDCDVIMKLYMAHHKRALANQIAAYKESNPSDTN